MCEYMYTVMNSEYIRIVDMKKGKIKHIEKIAKDRLDGGNYDIIFGCPSVCRKSSFV